MSSDSSLPIQQACAIPYHLVAGRIEVCLVTTIRKRRWVFPKGIIEPGETAPEAALKEAWEEAGLLGRIVGDALGSYERRKGGAHLVVTCFLMHVDRQSRRWHESALRARSWLPLDEAATVLSQESQKLMLAAARKLLQKRRPRAG